MYIFECELGSVVQLALNGISYLACFFNFFPSRHLTFKESWSLDLNSSPHTFLRIFLDTHCHIAALNKSP